LGPDLLTYLRDDTPGLGWAGMWDLPGGGREGDESPEACVLRELEEEFGLRFGPERLEQGWVWPSMMDATRPSLFYAGRITAEEVAAIRFGDEGQQWRMMAVTEFLGHVRAIPQMQQRVAVALTALGWITSQALISRGAAGGTSRP
jgi:8-oxo-dGTP diphosphatase